VADCAKAVSALNLVSFVAASLATLIRCNALRSAPETGIRTFSPRAGIGACQVCRVHQCQRCSPGAICMQPPISFMGDLPCFITARRTYVNTRLADASRDQGAVIGSRAVGPCGPACCKAPLVASRLAARITMFRQPTTSIIIRIRAKPLSTNAAPVPLASTSARLAIGLTSWGCIASFQCGRVAA